MSNDLPIWRKGFELMTEQHATREGVNYKTAPAKGAYHSCTSEDGEVCAFDQGSCRGIPCSAGDFRQHFPPGAAHLPKRNVVWIVDASPD